MVTPCRKAQEEENGDEKPEKVPETEKTEEKSEKMAEADVDTTAVRKSGRAPKPTEKLLEGKQQVGLEIIELLNTKPFPI